MLYSLLVVIKKEDKTHIESHTHTHTPSHHRGRINSVRIFARFRTFLLFSRTLA